MKPFVLQFFVQSFSAIKAQFAIACCMRDIVLRRVRERIYACLQKREPQGTAALNYDPAPGLRPAPDFRPRLFGIRFFKGSHAFAAVTVSIIFPLENQKSI